VTTLWSFILVLSVLIFFHELGHFLVARLLGIRVLKFSIGFGPRVWGLVRNGTDYCISAFPLGGFVKMLGEVPGEEIPADERAYAFSARPVWQRALVVVAGPLANFVLAMIIFIGIFIYYGDPIVLPEIGQVKADSPAYEAGIQPGDYILAVNGHQVKTWEDVHRLIQASKGEPVTLEIKRREDHLKIEVTPRISTVKNIFGEEVKTPLIGITAAGKLEVRRIGPVTAVVKGIERTWDLTVLTAQGFVKLFERVVPLSSLGGPIMIAQMAGEQAKQGFLNLFFFIGLLSINLGLLNLLPIPVLDGGHLFFYAIEAVRGRPLSQQQMQVVQQIGMFILLALMLLVFYNDIARLLGITSPVPTP